MANNGDAKVEAKVDELFGDDGYVTRDELIQILKDTEAILGEMKSVINVHADLLGAHQYVLAKFVPPPQLAAALKEYREQREKEIQSEIKDAN